METRKITIVSTKDQSKKVIMSSATTLAELKSDLRDNGIDYEGMTFFEGTSKVELKNDASVLPHDVPWKGTVTNELVFMLTNTNKKIKSGAMDRAGLYHKVKSLHLEEECKKRFGKNFTMCKTVDLEALVNAHEEVPCCDTQAPEAAPEVKCDCHNLVVDPAARAAVAKVVELLYANDLFDDDERDSVISILKGEVASVKSETKSESPYSDNEIDAMFDDIDI